MYKKVYKMKKFIKSWVIVVALIMTVGFVACNDEQDENKKSNKANSVSNNRITNVSNGTYTIDGEVRKIPQPSVGSKSKDAHNNGVFETICFLLKERKGAAFEISVSNDSFWSYKQVSLTKDKDKSDIVTKDTAELRKWVDAHLELGHTVKVTFNEKTSEYYGWFYIPDKKQP